MMVYNPMLPPCKRVPMMQESSSESNARDRGCFFSHCFTSYCDQFAQHGHLSAVLRRPRRSFARIDAVREKGNLRSILELLRNAKVSKSPNAKSPLENLVHNLVHTTATIGPTS
jgi:hypothetical protein